MCVYLYNDNYKYIYIYIHIYIYTYHGRICLLSLVSVLFVILHIDFVILTCTNNTDLLFVSCPLRLFH